VSKVKNKKLLSVVLALGLLLALPMSAGAQGLDLDFDFLFESIDEFGAEIGLSFGEGDNDANGITEVDHLALLRPILMYGAAGYTGLNSLEALKPGMANLIKADFSYNRNAAYEDVKIEGSGLLWTLFKDTVKDLLGGSYYLIDYVRANYGDALADMALDVLGAIGTVSETTTYPWLNTLIDTMIDTYGAQIPGVPPDIVDVLKDWIDLNAAAYKSWGNNNTLQPRQDLSAYGNVDDSGGLNGVEYAASATRETWLTGCHIVPPLRITDQPGPDDGRTELDIYTGDSYTMCVAATAGQGATRRFNWGTFDDLGPDQSAPIIFYTSATTAAYDHCYTIESFVPGDDQQPPAQHEHRYVAVVTDAVWKNTTRGLTLDAAGAKPILVTAPASDAQLLMGSFVNIQWQKNGDSSGSDVKIALHRGEDTFVQWVMRKTANDGLFAWKVPFDVAPGAGYSLRVQSYTDPMNRDFGPTFTIVQPNILLTAPNGGEWIRGQAYDITWTAPAAGAYVRLALHKGGSFHSWINRMTDNDGAYTWIVPESLPFGSDYNIRVQSYTDPMISDFGDRNLRIIPQPLVVVSPNGGETLTANAFATILWDSTHSGVGPYVRIGFYANFGGGWMWLDWLVRQTENDGAHTVKIPFDLPPMNDAYKIRIQSCDNPDYRDVSDAAFSIAAQPPIEVYSPNGGEVYAAGQSITVEWDDTYDLEVGPYVRIGFHIGKDFLGWVAEMTENDGAFTLTIPEYAPNDSRYRVRVQSYLYPTMRDFSDGFFTITNAGK